MTITFLAGNANSGASTLAVNGGSPIAIRKTGNVALAGNDIVANQMVTVVYDGTNLQFVASAPNNGGGGGSSILYDTWASRPSAGISGAFSCPRTAASSVSTTAPPGRTWRPASRSTTRPSTRGRQAPLLPPTTTPATMAWSPSTTTNPISTPGSGSRSPIVHPTPSPQRFSLATPQPPMCGWDWSGRFHTALRRYVLRLQRLRCVSCHPSIHQPVLHC